MTHGALWEGWTISLINKRRIDMPYLETTPHTYLPIYDRNTSLILFYIELHNDKYLP